jgi:dTDP-4-amino-4,6-dideoxygalactose transaminase
MDKFMKISEKYNIPIIEDCSQAHLTRYKGKLVGTIGKFGTFSFQQSKHITCGDGGITITNDDKLAKRMSLFIDKGCDWTEDRKYRLQYAFFAPCYRMTELQGAVLLAQLKKIEFIVKQRQKLGDQLTYLLKNIHGIYPPERNESVEHSYWAFPLRIVKDELNISRDKFINVLNAEGIHAGGPWPGKPLYLYESLLSKIAFGKSNIPWDLTKFGRKIAYREGLCPKAELAENQLVTIGINEKFTENDIIDISKAIHKISDYFSK